MNYQDFHTLFLIFLIGTVISGILLLILFFTMNIRYTFCSVFKFAKTAEIKKIKKKKVNNENNHSIMIKNQPQSEPVLNIEQPFKKVINTVPLEEDYNGTEILDEPEIHHSKYHTEELDNNYTENLKTEQLYEEPVDYGGTVVLSDVDEEYGYVGSNDIVDI